MGDINIHRVDSTESAHQQVLKQVEGIARSHLTGTGAKIYLFGSWARGEERSSSDIDLGVWYATAIPLGTLTRLRTAYEESTIPYRVEVVDLVYSDEAFRQIVFTEGIQWNV